jgi:hypothetical protein
MNPIVQTLLRTILKAGGGALIAKGLLDDSQLEEGISAVMLLIGIVWGIKHRTPGAAAVAVRKGAIALLVIVAMLSPGCANFDSHQVQTKQDGTTTESHTKITTFFDSSTQIAKLRSSTTDKTQGLTVGGFSEESAGTNAVSLVERVSAAVVGAAISAAK